MIDEPFVIRITPPPSTNNLYVNTQRGRAKSKAYKAWIETAGWEIREQLKGPLPHFPSTFGLRIWLPGQKDIDNIKAIPDLLKKMGIISDDKHMISLQVLRYSDPLALIAVNPMSPISAASAP